MGLKGLTIGNQNHQAGVKLPSGHVGKSRITVPVVHQQPIVSGFDAGSSTFGDHIMSVFTYQHFLDAQNKLSGIASVSGIRVVFSEHACDPEYELVKRSWKERLFTRPWEPRRKYNQVMTALNPQMFKMNTTGGEMIVAHPTFKEQLRHLTTV